MREVLKNTCLMYVITFAAPLSQAIAPELFEFVNSHLIGIYILWIIAVSIYCVLTQGADHK